MHTVHAGFSFVCPVRTDAVPQARAVLTRMKATVGTVFAQSKTTHFLTASVLDEMKRGRRTLPPTLLLLTSYWGPTRAHVEEIVEHAGPDLRDLFQCCTDAPDPGCTKAELVEYMKRRRKPDTFYSGMHNVTHQQVLDDLALRRAIEAHVDADPKTWMGLTALQARTKIQDFVRNDPALLGLATRTPYTWHDLWVHYRHIFYVLSVPLLLAVLVAVGSVTRTGALTTAAAYGGVGVLAIVGLLVALLATTWICERLFDGPSAPRQPDRRVNELEETQLNPVINEFTVAGPIKAGWFRPIFLRILLWIVARHITAQNSTIKTVAAARWLAIDGGRRLIFVSNYTNMAEGYVRDFIDTRWGAGNINLVFSWGIGYPKTTLVYLKGAREDSNGFINVVHAQTRDTGLWYCPYRTIGIDNIKLNRDLRQGLFDPAIDGSEARADAWLRTL